MEQLLVCYTENEGGPFFRELKSNDFIIYVLLLFSYCVCDVTSHSVGLRVHPVLLKSGSCLQILYATSESDLTGVHLVVRRSVS